MAWTRVIPNLMVIVPVDPVETRAAMRWAKDHIGPVFLRISRMPVPVLLEDGFVFEPGKATVLREGHDVTLIANGVLVSRAQLVVKGIQAQVLNMSSVLPIDREAI